MSRTLALRLCRRRGLRPINVAAALHCAVVGRSRANRILLQQLQLETFLDGGYSEGSVARRKPGTWYAIFDLRLRFMQEPL